MFDLFSGAKELTGEKAIMFMLLLTRAQLATQSQLLVEIAEKVLDKDKTTLNTEFLKTYTKQIQEIHELFLDDDRLLNFIKNMDLGKS